MIKQLTLNEETERIELNGDELHCGDPLTVMIINAAGKPEWIKTWIEFSHNRRCWYLSDFPNIQVNGLFAKYACSR